MPMPMEKRYTADEFYKLNLPDHCELINGQILPMCSRTVITEPFEFDGGQIVNMSPSPSIKHQEISSELSYTIKNYIKKNGGKCKVFTAPTDVQINDKEVVMPDIFVACDPDKFDSQKYNGAPDFIIEIVSPSNPERDYKDKLLMYKTAGVKEYWIIDPSDERVIVYLFGQPNITEFYTFADTITVGLYKNNAEPLTICIDELLGN